MKISFGPDQLLKATPAIIARIRRGLNFFTSGVLIFLPAVADQLGTTTEALSTKIGLFMLAFNSLAQMFGVEITDPVKASDVTEVETNNN